MAISYVAAGAIATAASGNVTPALPAGWAADDVHICLIASLDAVSPTMPAGWTALISPTDSGNGTRVSAFYRRAVAGDANPLVTHTAGAGISAVIVAYRGCAASGSPIDVMGTAVAAASNATTSMSFGSLTTLTANAHVVMLGGIGANRTVSNYSGSPTPDERVDGPNSVSTIPEVVVADFVMAAAGSTGTRTADLSAGRNRVGVMAALKPATTAVTIFSRRGLSPRTGTRTAGRRAMY